MSVSLAPARYRVVKIVCSCSEVVLQTMKNYKAQYDLSWFRPLLRGNMFFAPRRYMVVKITCSCCEVVL
jgi:hypothetical protein